MKLQGARIYSTIVNVSQAEGDSVNTAERTFVILKRVNKTPSLAACSNCQRKFFTPNSYYNDRSGAEYYLKQKFDLHSCEERANLRIVRRW